MPQDYNATIQLPKTDFPMRAGLPKREPEMLRAWKKLDVYGELLKKNANKPRFSLHDGKNCIFISYNEIFQYWKHVSQG